MFDCTHMFVKWQTVRKLGSHVKILGLVLLTN